MARSTALLPLLFLLAFWPWLAPQAAEAAPVRTDHVDAELVADVKAIAPAQPFTVALRLVMEEHWHTYWKNPGDSGLPTTLTWRLPPGFTAGELQWPAPRRIPVPPLANYGYEGEVLLLTTITPPPILPAKPITLSARADWLVCREVCLPGGADLQLTLPQRNPEPSAWAPAIARARELIPGPLTGWTAWMARGDEGPRLALIASKNPGAVGELKQLEFFPADEGRIEPAAPQRVVRHQNGIRIELKAPKLADDKALELRGVVVANGGPGAPGGWAAEVRAQRALPADLPGRLGPEIQALATADGTPPRTAAAPGSGSPSMSFWLAALLAAGGGLLLNLMPCVFPVLSLKVLGFAQHAGTEADPAVTRRAMRRHGLAFAAGVVASFLVLAAVLLGLRAAGEAIGWGFQLQAPPLVTAMALLFFVLGLNLGGLFEFLPNASRLAGLAARHPYADSLLSGVLAAVVASPCTAPFMGAALGYAVTQSPLQALAVFAALGVGMALPYVALAWFPQWLKRLPRPGAWMAHLKTLLAFPLFATVAWLGWVLGQQLGVDALARLLLVLVLLGLAGWAYGLAQQGARRFRWLAIVAALASGWVSLPLFNPPDAASSAPATANAGGNWAPYSQEQVERLVAAGRPVFVDFTAAWCITCQANKRLVLDTESVQAAFQRSQVALLRADWTRRDPAITQALTALGRSGVPVYVLYVPGREPQLLPEVLSESIVMRALAELPPARPAS